MNEQLNNINYTKISNFTIARKKIIPEKVVKEKMESFFSASRSSKKTNFGDQDGEYAAIHNLPEFKWLTKEIEIMVIQYLTDLGYDTHKFSIFFQKSWTVITNPGGMVSNHSHPNSLLSAVYYLKAEKDKGGSLIFNANNSLFKGNIDHYAINPNVEEQFTGIKPIQNNLVIFPSSLEHLVSIYKGEGSRLSITFDITITTSSELGSARSENIMIHPKYWKEFNCNKIIKNKVQPSKFSSSKDYKQLSSLLEKGYLVIENLIDKPLCDRLFHESIINLGFNNKSNNFKNDHLRINNLISLSENSSDVIKYVTKELEYTLKKFLDQKEEQYLAELGNIFSFPGSLREKIHRKIMNRKTKFITMFINLFDTFPENGGFTYYPGSHLKFPFDMQTKSRINPVKFNLPKGSVTLLDSRLFYYLNANISENKFLPLFYFSYGEKNLETKKFFIKEELRGKYTYYDFL